MKSAVTDMMVFPPPWFGDSGDNRKWFYGGWTEVEIREAGFAERPPGVPLPKVKKLKRKASCTWIYLRTSFPPPIVQDQDSVF